MKEIKRLERYKEVNKVLDKNQTWHF
jgi:hypothetical protein